MRFINYRKPIQTVVTLWKYLWPLIIAVVWCEYLIYYFVVYGFCSWPELTNHTDEVVRTIVLSDTHLIGNRKGHPLDKLRREWQMYRSFQSAVTVFHPKLVLVLGDVFDEGLIASPKEFDEYTERFGQIFQVPQDTKILVATGNHDVGFHDRMMVFEPYLRQRFEIAFNISLVQLVEISGIPLVNINSMALEGDYCHICSESMELIEQLSNKIKSKCTNHPTSTCITRPILITHFPLYRKSDEDCKEADSATGSERYAKMRPRIDCISSASSNFLLNSLNPRLVLTGHTHNGCVTTHGIKKIPEWTVASFNWRNRANPSFLLLALSKNDHNISKCFLPNENTVINIYFTTLVILIANFVWHKVR